MFNYIPRFSPRDDAVNNDEITDNQMANKTQILYLIQMFSMPGLPPPLILCPMQIIKYQLLNSIYRCFPHDDSANDGNQMIKTKHFSPKSARHDGKFNEKPTQPLNHQILIRYAASPYKTRSSSPP